MARTTPAPLPDSHVDIVAKAGFAHVATVGPDGAPQSTPVWYRWDDGTLLFSTTKRRHKYRNLSADPRVAVSILDPDDPYRHVDIRGVAEIRDDPDGSLIRELSERYLGQDFDGDLRDRVVVRIVPTRVHSYG